MIGIEGSWERLFPGGVIVFLARPPSIVCLMIGRVRQQSMSAPNRRCGPGERLRALRVVHGLSLRDVHDASVRLSRKLRSQEFLLPPSRLHEFETRDVVPSVHRLYTLSRIYGYQITDLLNWYGIPQEPRAKTPAQK